MFVPLAVGLLFVNLLSGVASTTSRDQARKKLNELRELKDEFMSLGRTEQRAPLNFDDLRREEKESTSAKFMHAQQMVAALRRGDTKFEVVEFNNDIEGQDVHTAAIYETTTSYHLKEVPTNYIVLDDITDADQAPQHMRELAEGHILHCGRALQDWPLGSFVLGTERGPWATVPHVSRYLISYFDTLHATHAQQKRKNGFLVVRRVTEVHETNLTECTRVHTEDIHPIELFDKFRIESLLHRPVNHNYGTFAVEGANVGQVAEDRATLEQEPHERALFSKYATPDLPVIKCTNKTFAPFTTGLMGKYSYVYGDPGIGNDDTKSFVVALSLLNGGCVEYSKDMDGGFNFNYNPTTNTAVTPSISLGGSTVTGLTCTNCYAYLGAGFLLILEYTSGFSISAEGKIAGGAGFNASVSIVNPAVSGSSSLKLLPAATTWGAIPLGESGMSFQYKFGGLTALVSGSGSAQGSAAFGAGLGVSASMAALYAKGNLKFPYSFKTFSNAPFYTSAGFTSSSMSVTATLTGTENFGIQYGSGGLLSIGFYFDGNIDGTTTYKFGAALTSTAAANVALDSAPAKSPNRMHALESRYYYPGDTIDLNFVYDAFPKQEAITLFYTFVKANGETKSIMMQHFNTSATGSGTLYASWTVPWDEYFAEEWPQKESRISIKASNDITTEYLSPPFGLKIFTEVDGILLAPAPGEVVPTDTPYEVQWNASLLMNYVPNAWNRPDGKSVLSKSVVFELCGESVASNGTITSFWCEYLNKRAAVPNTGDATLTFFSNYTNRADRFYLNVHSNAHLSVYGWSKGYFLLGSQGTTGSPNRLHAQDVNTISPKVFRRQTPRTVDTSETGELSRRVLNTAKQVSCNGAGATNSVSFGSTAGAQSKSLSVSSYSYDLSSSTAAATIVSPTPTCYYDTPSPTGVPSVAPTSSPVDSGSATASGSIGAIVGGVVGGVAGLAIVAALVYFLFLRKSPAAPAGRVVPVAAVQPAQPQTVQVQVQ